MKKHLGTAAALAILALGLLCSPLFAHDVKSAYMVRDGHWVWVSGLDIRRAVDVLFGAGFLQGQELPHGRADCTVDSTAIWSQQARDRGTVIKCRGMEAGFPNYPDEEYSRQLLQFLLPSIGAR